MAELLLGGAPEHSLGNRVFLICAVLVAPPSVSACCVARGAKQPTLMALQLQCELELARRNVFGLEQDLAEPAANCAGDQQRSDQVVAFGLGALHLREFAPADQADAD